MLSKVSQTSSRTSKRQSNPIVDLQRGVQSYLISKSSLEQHGYEQAPDTIRRPTQVAGPLGIQRFSDDAKRIWQTEKSFKVQPDFFVRGNTIAKVTRRPTPGRAPRAPQAAAAASQTSSWRASVSPELRPRPGLWPQPVPRARARPVQRCLRRSRRLVAPSAIPLRGLFPKGAPSFRAAVLFGFGYSRSSSRPTFGSASLSPASREAFPSARSGLSPSRTRTRSARRSSRSIPPDLRRVRRALTKRLLDLQRARSDIAPRRRRRRSGRPTSIAGARFLSARCGSKPTWFHCARADPKSTDPTYQNFTLKVAFSPF